MKALINRTKIASLIAILIYIQAFVFCSFEYYRVSLGTVANDTGLIFVGLMIISLYFYIIALPTAIVPKVTSIRLILIIILTILASVLLPATQKWSYVLENIILAIGAIWIMWRQKMLRRKLMHKPINDYVLTKFKVYKLLELNTLNFVMFLCIVGSQILLGITTVTLSYSSAITAIILLTNYLRMFRSNIRCQSKSLFALECAGIIVTQICVFITGYLSWRWGLKLIALIPAVAYCYSVWRVWRDYHNLLYDE